MSIQLSNFRRHVRDGSTIYTDCWKGYNNLTKEGFEHMTVNHSLHFVDPDTGVDTNKIESQWRPLRRRLARGGVQKDKLAAHLAEFLWRRDCSRRGVDPFGELTVDIRNVHDV